MVQPNTKPVDILSFVVKAIKGELVLPFFQRGFVWDSELKEKLFESFLNAEYLNNIITATLNHDLPIPVRTLTSFFDDTEKLKYKPDMEILVDGQQRITSLIEWLFSDVIGLMKTSTKKFIPLLYLRRNGNEIEIVKVEYINRNKIIDNVKFDDKASDYRERLSEINLELFSSFLGENLIERLNGKPSKKLKGYVLLSMALLEPPKYVEKIAESFVEYENGVLKIPAFLIRYIPLFDNREGFSGTLLDFVFENEADKLEDILEGVMSGKSDKDVRNFIRTIERKLLGQKSTKVTHVEFTDIDSVETLAEVFEKINTVQVKLGYFDIMESILATIEGEPVDIRGFLDDEISSYQYVSFLGKVKSFHENFLRGFASWLEMVKLTEDERRKIIGKIYSGNLNEVPYLSFKKYIEIGSRKISVGEYIKYAFESGVSCSGENGTASERLRTCLREYIESLNKSLKKFDEITKLLTFYKVSKSDNIRILNLKGTILFFALPVFEDITEDERMKWKYMYEFSKFYLYALFNSSNAFRHPENLIRNSNSGKTNIVMTPNGVYFPKEYDIREELMYFIDDFAQISAKSVEKLDLEYLSASDYFMMFYIQSLYSFKRNFVSENEDIKKDEIKKSMSNEAYSLDGEKLSFSTSDRFDVHHIFPKKTGDKTVYKRDHVLNLALLKKVENQSISNRDPQEYWNWIIENKDARKILDFYLIPTRNTPPTETLIKPEILGEYVLFDYSKKEVTKRLKGNEIKFWKDRFVLLIEAIGHIFNFHDEEVRYNIKKQLTASNYES